VGQDRKEDKNRKRIRAKEKREKEGRVR